MSIQGKLMSIQALQTLVTSPQPIDWRVYGRVAVKTMSDLMIFNYLPEVQYEGGWNWFETVSRGLIMSASTGEVVARPFDKFWNWGQGEFTLAQPRFVMEKMDGSLGILYRAGHLGDPHYRVATRGSFDSPQAQWATQHLNENYSLLGLHDAHTLLFEIIYPENRIVVDYGARAELVLLAIRNRYTGEYLPQDDVTLYANHYGFSRPQMVYKVPPDNKTHMDLHGDEGFIRWLATSELMKTVQEKADLLGEEGYVVYFEDDSMFKIKSDKYITLHKLVFGLSRKTILDLFKERQHEGDSLTESALWVENHCASNGVPDEMMGDVRKWVMEIHDTIMNESLAIHELYTGAPKDNRKTFAQWVMTNHRQYRAHLFAIWDGKPLAPIILKGMK